MKDEIIPIRFPTKVGNHFQDSLASEQISKISNMRPKKDFQDFQDFARLRAGVFTNRNYQKLTRNSQKYFFLAAITSN